MSFIEQLDKFADYIKTARPSITHATIDVTEGYARKKLHAKKDEPLIYRGLSLSCRGSKKWRNENQAHW